MSKTKKVVPKKACKRSNQIPTQREVAMDTKAIIMNGIVEPKVGEGYVSLFRWKLESTKSFFSDTDDNFSLGAHGYYYKGPDLREYLHAKLPGKRHCQACADGALFLGFVYRHNQEKFDHSFSFEQIAKRLRNTFTIGQLRLIESAFELMAIGTTATYPNFQEAISFGKGFGDDPYKNSQKRMLGILDNIIKYGQFRPDLGLEDLAAKKARAEARAAKKGKK